MTLVIRNTANSTTIGNHSYSVRNDHKTVVAMVMSALSKQVVGNPFVQPSNDKTNLKG